MQAKEYALEAVKFALDKKAQNIRLFEIRELSSLSDYLLIISGRSDRQVQAIAESIRLGFKNQHQELPLAVEGYDEGRWVLLDYGEVMVHVFQEPVRQFYDLEGLWSEAPEVPLSLEQAG